MKNALTYQLLSSKTTNTTLLIAFLMFTMAGKTQVSPEPERGLMAGQAINPAKSVEPGLLFYLSGDKQFNADFAAGGQTQPNFLRDVKIVPNGALGNAFE